MRVNMVDVLFLYMYEYGTLKSVRVILTSEVGEEGE
jgi:hypothetical protein